MSGDRPANPSDVERLFRNVMEKSPAERLQLAGMILATGRGDLEKIAVDIAQRALDEVNLRRLSRLASAPLRGGR